MNLKELNYILTVAEERNLSKAAEKLYITQPSLSRIIMKTEVSLGVKIFDRTKSPLVVTFAGELFIKTAKQMLTLESKLYQEMREIANLKKGRVTIGIMQFEEKYYLPQVLSHFYTKYPGIEVKIIADTSAGLESLIINDTVDFAIAIKPISTSNIAYQEIYATKILLALPTSHPLAVNYQLPVNKNSYPMINLECLKDENFVVLKPGRQMRNITFDICQKAGFTPKIALEVDSFDTANAFAVAGYGPTFILEPMIRYYVEEQQAAYFTIAGQNLTQTVVFAYKEDKPLSNASKAFLDIIEHVPFIE